MGRWIQVIATKGIKKRRERTQITNIRNRKENITIDATDTTQMIKEH